MFFFFKKKTAYEVLRSVVGSEECIRDRGILWGYVGNTLVILWIYLGGYIGNPLGILGEHFGNTSGIHWGYFGVTFWITKVYHLLLIHF